MLVFTPFSPAFSRASRGLIGCALALGLLASLQGHGQAPAARPRPDTLVGRRHRLPEAQVHAVRPERFAVGSQRLEVDSAALAQYRGGTAADALGARLGLYIKNYGPGQLATISLLGTS